MQPALAVGDFGQEDAALQAGFITAKGETPKVAGQSSVYDLIGVIVKAGLSFLGIIFFGLMVYAGFIWMRAMGNTEHVTQAKNILESAVIGLVLVLAAYAIASFVFERLTGQTAGSAGGGTAPETKCQTQFGDKEGKCIDIKDCDEPKVPTPGLCPGPNEIQCCHNL